MLTADTRKKVRVHFVSTFVSVGCSPSSLSAVVAAGGGSGQRRFANYISGYQSLYISIYITVYISIYISVYISVYQSIYVSPSFSSLHILHIQSRGGRVGDFST